ncbi:Thiol:disulfide interchange protein DsbA precursor [Vibrio thalassae]|uniref:Thiol:disulfide interchange protein DsbA n=1 Tax=Vibrio thalassae TaxID=1243014 RepID=A0A240EIX4_9VIBR|nr:thioredoxin domain-containing protein [Vibrio thalassae]SNX48536.1 Thiol:disulfide interchange protein DsbA precursor [Vibrio thalassae]
MKNILLYLALSLFSTAVFSIQFEKGKHYVTLPHSPTIDAQVMLFHSPYCGPCAMVHRPLVEMVQKHGLIFNEIVVGMGPVGRDVQEAFVVAQGQGTEQAFIEELIHRIHFRRDQTPKFRSDIADVLEVCGVNSQSFEQRCNQIQDKVEDFNSLIKEYRIRATPTIVVNGNQQIVLHQLSNLEELERLIVELTS